MAEQSRTYVDSLMLQVLIRTASGKGGGRNTKTEATTTAWHEGLQKLRLFTFYLCCDRWGWGWELIMLWRSISIWDYLTGPQTTITVIIIPVLTRPGNCGTCSVGQVNRATLSKTHPWSGWSSAVWFQPSHWAHCTPSSGQPARAERFHMTLIGFEPKTFRPAVRCTNHYATGVCRFIYLFLIQTLQDMYPYRPP